jgi:hypothetical protein
MPDVGRPRTAVLALCSALAGCVTPATAAEEAVTTPIEQIGVVAHAPIAEMSGMVKSRTYDGVYWVHNDSGDEARLFAIDAEGDVIFPSFLAPSYYAESAEPGREPWPGLSVTQASNVDWEDVAVAEGRLYIGDIGNNGNARRDLGVYVVNEPNPRATAMTRALRFLPLRYPEQSEFPGRQWHYDSESLFASDGKLYVITRRRKPGKIDEFEPGAKLYRLDTDYTERENVLTIVDSHDGVTLPSAADLSPDGTKLAVLTYTALWVFEKPARGDRWLSGRARRITLSLAETKQAEAVCWDDPQTLRLANEQREIFRVKLSSLRPVD